MYNTGNINSLAWYWDNLNTGSTIDYLPQIYIIGILAIVIAFMGLILANRKNLKSII